MRAQSRRGATEPRLFRAACHVPARSVAGRHTGSRSPVGGGYECRTRCTVPLRKPSRGRSTETCSNAARSRCCGSTTTRRSARSAAATMPAWMESVNFPTAPRSSSSPPLGRTRAPTWSATSAATEARAASGERSCSRHRGRSAGAAAWNWTVTCGPTTASGSPRLMIAPTSSTCSTAARPGAGNCSEFPARPAR